MAVTKKHPAALVDAAAAAGLSDIGENRIQEALAKAPDVTAPVTWHLIGHLQRNKVRRAVELFSWIHSVDSIRLVDALAATEVPQHVFLQVNVAGEARKTGVAPEQARALLQAAVQVPTLSVQGLMTMAPFGADAEAARPHFRALRELRDDLVARGDAPPLPYLSMGMSGDFSVAVEEGATHLRLGTALFGPRR